MISYFQKSGKNCTGKSMGFLWRCQTEEKVTLAIAVVSDNGYLIQPAIISFVQVHNLIGPLHNFIVSLG